MRKSIKVVIIVVVIAIISFLGYSITKKIQYKNNVATQIKQLPEFSLLKLNGQKFTQNDVNFDHPCIFIYFNSECHFCQNETVQIQKHLKEFSNCQLFFISSEKEKEIRDFATQNKLIHYDNINFLRDSRATFAATFDIAQTPTMLIYNKHHQLLKKIKGQTNISSVIALLNK